MSIQHWAWPMIDELIKLAVATAVDTSIDKVAKYHRWVRILRAMGGLLFTAIVIALIFVTFKYS